MIAALSDTWLLVVAGLIAAVVAFAVVLWSRR